jgi:hypothetical protein
MPMIAFYKSVEGRVWIGTKQELSLYARERSQENVKLFLGISRVMSLIRPHIGLNLTHKIEHIPIVEEGVEFL